MPDTYLQTVRQFNRNVRLFLLSAALIGFTTSGGVQGVLLNLYLLRLGYGLDFVGQINSIGGLVFALFSLPAATSPPTCPLLAAPGVAGARGAPFNFSLAT